MDPIQSSIHYFGSDSESLSEFESHCSTPPADVSATSTPLTEQGDYFSGARDDDFILVVGGLGYIGSHTSWELLKSGKNIVIIDNLSNSNCKSHSG